MFRLTREVRFAINDREDEQWNRPPTNSYGGYPSLTGFGHYLALRITLRGELHPASQYLINIKEIDEAIRVSLRKLSPLVQTASPTSFLQAIHRSASELWRERLERLSLSLSPFLTLDIHTSDTGNTMRLSQKFEFSASHRLHNSSFSEEINRRTFGKCSNPMGHGHNYEVQVTLKGTPDANGLLIDVPQFEQTVAETVIEKFDHKNLNEQVPEFRNVIPTVENIARVTYQLLKPKLKSNRAELASVTVWETPKTFCEYSE